MNVKIKMGKLVFAKIRQCEYLVFDEVGSDILKKHIFRDVPVFVLPARKERYFVSPFILFHFCILFCQNLYLNRTRSQINKVGLLDTYFAAVIKTVRPKAVLTWIDTSSSFSRLNQMNLKIPMIAIQNGNRLHLLKEMQPLHLGHFFCFGDIETEHYRKSGHLIRNYYPVGSILGDFASRNIESAHDYNVCVVSQWRDHFMIQPNQPHFRKGIATMFEYAAKLAELEKRKNQKFKMIVACASNLDTEFNYLRGVFPSWVEIVRNDREAMSTYRAMRKSDFVIGFFSTALSEAVGWGKRVLFCNYTDDPTFDFQIDRRLCSNGKSFEEFFEKYTELSILSERQFLEFSAPIQKLVMKYPKTKPNYELIRDALIQLPSGAMSRTDEAVFKFDHF